MAKDGSALPFILFGAGGLALLALTQTGSEKKVIELPTQIPGTPTEFIRKNFPQAKQSEAATGVPALVSLAQAGLESGYGKHAPGNNFFGIKAGKSWSGETQLLRTWECGKTGDPKKDGITDQIIEIFAPGDKRGICGDHRTGTIYESIDSWVNYRNRFTDQLAGIGAGKLYSYRVYGKFRKYPTPADGFKDHARFLNSNKRYAAAFTYKTNPERFADEIARAGYATAPNYANALRKVITLIRKVI